MTLGEQDGRVCLFSFEEGSEMFRDYDTLSYDRLQKMTNPGRRRRRRRKKTVKIKHVRHSPHDERFPLRSWGSAESTVTSIRSLSLSPPPSLSPLCSLSFTPPLLCRLLRRPFPSLHPSLSLFPPACPRRSLAPPVSRGTQAATQTDKPPRKKNKK